LPVLRNVNFEDLLSSANANRKIDRPDSKLIKSTTSIDIDSPLQAVVLNEGLRCKEKLWGKRGRQQLGYFVWLCGPAVGDGAIYLKFIE